MSGEPVYEWPKESGWYSLSCSDSNYTERWRLFRSGRWSEDTPEDVDLTFSTDEMKQHGYLGVRRAPEIDEEKERERFEAVACKGPFDMERDSDGIYFSREVGFAWEMWLAAKRDERGS